MEAKYRSKEIIWAKIEPYPWWPGKIINIHIQCNQIVYKILFFADPTYAYLQQSQLCAFNDFDRKYNAHHFPDARLTKAVKLADEAYTKIQHIEEVKSIPLPLQHKKTSAKSAKQSSVYEFKSSHEIANAHNSNQNQPIELAELHILKNAESLEKFKCEETAVSPFCENMLSPELASSFEQITQDNIIQILENRIKNPQQFESNYQNRKSIIKHKLELKTILLERYNLHHFSQSSRREEVQATKRAANSSNNYTEGNTIKAGKGFKKYRIHRKKLHISNMPHLKEKCMRKLYEISKLWKDQSQSHLHLKGIAVSLIKRISHLSEDSEMKYKSLFVTLIRSFQNQLCKVRSFDERMTDFSLYLDRFENEKHEDEEGSKMTQISVQTN